MKNSENYGVQELNAQEIQETEGGILRLIIIGIFLWSTAAY